MIFKTSFIKPGAVIMYILVALIMVILAILVLIIINSPGKPRVLSDETGKALPDSISEKNYIEIDGGKLGFYIKGGNKNNPVLLYLHGGMPDYFLTQKYPTGLDEVFTVVWWDQRGAGLSYDARYKDRAIDIDDLVNDTKVITDYLRSRFSQDKIYVMAHSGGTFLGIKVISKYPELYAAYIAVSQVSNPKLSEKKAYDYIVEHYKNDKNRRKIVGRLLRNPIVLTEPIPVAYLKVRDYAMHDLGIGTMHDMKNVMTGIFIPSLLFREYTIKDKIDLWKGKAGSGISVMWNEMNSHDLSKEYTTFEIPVYFLHGVLDYTCSYELAKEYFETIRAPIKKFFSFDNSAHSPIFEEPQKCIAIMKEEVLPKAKTY